MFDLKGKKLIFWLTIVLSSIIFLLERKWIESFLYGAKGAEFTEPSFHASSIINISNNEDINSHNALEQRNGTREKLNQFYYHYLTEKLKFTDENSRAKLKERIKLIKYLPQSFEDDQLWSLIYTINWKKEICNLVPNSTSRWSQSIVDPMSNVSFINLKNFQSYESEVSSKYNASSVFMIETTCRQDIQPRDLCNIESYAYHNPKSAVMGLYLASQMHDPSGILSDVINAYSNLHLFNYNFTQLVEGTPIELVVREGTWANKPDWIPQMLSDLFRIATVWKYGGLYSDNDFICLKELDFLQNEDNVLHSSVESQKIIGNGIFKMTPRHIFPFNVMMNLSRDYEVTFWGFSGPSAFTKATEQLCNVKKIGELIGQDSKCGEISTVFHSNKFYPIHWKNSKSIFEEPSQYHDLEFLENSNGMHLANSITHSVPCNIHGNSLFARLAAKHCPVTLKALNRANIKSF